MKIVIVLILVINMALVSAGVEVGFGDGTGQTGVNIFIPETATATNTSNVNQSDYWNTGDRGPLRNVADIEHNWLSNLLWSVAGHVMDTFLDMNGYNIIDVDTIFAENLNFSDQIQDDNSTSYIIMDEGTWVVYG